MRDYEFDDDEPYVVIERSAGMGSFLIGAAIGAGLALLMAPKAGVETRRDLKRSARRVQRAATDVVEDATSRVGSTFTEARRQVEDRIDAARQAIELKRDQVERAMYAGRDAARDARSELERRIAETKAETRSGYDAGGGVARSSRGRATTGRVIRDRATVADEDPDGV